MVKRCPEKSSLLPFYVFCHQALQELGLNLFCFFPFCSDFRYILLAQVECQSSFAGPFFFQRRSVYWVLQDVVETRETPQLTSTTMDRVDMT